MNIARRLIAEEREKQTGFLDLGNLRLTEVPVELFELTHLRGLNLGTWYVDEHGEFHRSSNGEEDNSNVLRALPKGFGALDKLLTLSLIQNPLSDLGPLRALTALQQLNCSYTQVSDLGPLRSLTALQQLNYSHTQVSDLDPLRSLTALQQLTCWNTQVIDLGPLRSLTALQQLTCSGTQVSDLGPLRSLTALQQLNCSVTQVSDLGPLRSLTALQQLTCSGTQVSDLDPLRALTALQQLDCRYTQVSDLGPLRSLTALQQLDCRYTQVSDLSPLRSLTALQQLNCSHTQVSDLGPLRSLTALQQLTCSGTQVSDLDPLRALTALQQLNCRYTQVSDLSPLRSLTALQQLNCSYTQVSDLGPLRSLTALQQLTCSGTQVSDLDPLRSLTALQQLNCSHTQVSDLGPLRSLTALQQLDCSHTPVSDLGPLIGTMSLQKLVANGCRLEDFPQQLLFQKNLLELTLHEATIPGIPAEVLSADLLSNCLEDLRAHLVDTGSGIEEVQEAKLVVLGNGRVGKTQICRRLRGLPYDDKVASTHGITVTAEPWTGATNEEVLNIWDFGGQDIYHGAHTLFMSTSAVFLIVWYPDFETTGEQSADDIWFRNYPLPYWLEYVRTLGRRDCPVIVVQARCDRPEQEVRRLPADDVFLEFPSLKPCWYSAKTNRGHGALEDALGDAIRYLRNRDGIVTIGVGRAKVLRQLETWRNEDQKLPASERLHRTLSQEEFHNLCEEIGDVRSPERLLAYLHNLGVVFHQSHLFGDRIILDQSWALEAVYAVFDRQKAYPLILSQRGRFTQSLLAMTAWRDYSDTDQRLFLSLMESCGIAFVHRDAEPKTGLATEYLAPDLLPEKESVADQLAGRWNEHEASWRLEYDYPFLHPGLMRALLCDIGNTSKEAGVYWKYGVWLYEKSTSCRALLDQQMHDQRRGRIVLTVQGQRHQELALWLRERIEQRNRLFGYPELQPTVNDFGIGPKLLERTEAGQVMRNKPGSMPDQLSGESSVGPPAPRMAHEPSFDKPPESFFPLREPQVFVSYAWGDDTAAGQQRTKVVDDLCVSLRQRGITVRRDRDEMRPGDLISEFMDRLTEGDFVIVVISDKYLRSEYCMYELFRIYRNCADRPDRFLRKVIPMILPDSKIDKPADRLQRAIHWTTQEEELAPLVEKNVKAVGTEFFRKFKLIGEFARNTSNMLEHLVDKLQPRDFERQAKEGFKEILEQLTRRR